MTEFRVRNTLIHLSDDTSGAGADAFASSSQFDPPAGAVSAPAWARAAAQLLAGAPPSGGFSLNIATGQNAAGVIQTAGDLADAH